MPRSIHEAYCYPNPLKMDQRISFAKVPEEKMIKLKIYTIAGELVYEGEEQSNNEGKIIFDLNKEISSGIYLWLLDDGASKQIGKLVIIK